MARNHKGLRNPGQTRKKTGKTYQSRCNGTTSSKNMNVEPISICATLVKCQQGRRHFNKHGIATNAKRIRHATTSKIRRQLAGSVMWI